MRSSDNYQYLMIKNTYKHIKNNLINVLQKLGYLIPIVTTSQNVSIYKLHYKNVHLFKTFFQNVKKNALVCDDIKIKCF